MNEARGLNGIHESGEFLVVTSDPIEPVERLFGFLAQTGLSDDDVVTSPLVTTPIPVYPSSYPEPGCFGVTESGMERRRWAGLKPEAMAHPLMWLPPRVAHRYEVTDEEVLDEDGNPTVSLESDEAWMVRVTMEATACGLYNPDKGEWFDMMSGVHLDIDNDADLARIEEWLDGAEDPLLDGIDLTPMLDDEDDLHWGIRETDEWMEAIRFMVWGTHSEAILGYARDISNGITDGVPTTDPEDAFLVGHIDEDTPLVPMGRRRAQDCVRLVADFSLSSFSGIGEDEEAWWQGKYEEVVQAGEADVAPDDLASGHLLEMIDRLHGISDDFTSQVVEAAEQFTTGVGPNARAKPEIVDALQQLDDQAADEAEYGKSNESFNW